MIEQFIKSVKKFKGLWIVVLVIAVMGIISKADWEYKRDIVYNESLHKVIATVEGTDITLKDFAVYVAYQEAEVESQAKIYDSENPKKYWGLHTNGTFLKFFARDEALSMAIHDRLFFVLAGDLNITLSEEEKMQLANSVSDFWSDLTDEGKEIRLGITEDDVYQTMEQIAIAEKSQLIYAEMNGVDYEDFHFSEEDFLRFLENYDYEVNENILERLDFGNITLDH